MIPLFGDLVSGRLLKVDLDRWLKWEVFVDPGIQFFLQKWSSMSAIQISSLWCFKNFQYWLQSLTLQNRVIDYNIVISGTESLAVLVPQTAFEKITLRDEFDPLDYDCNLAGHLEDQVTDVKLYNYSNI